MEPYLAQGAVMAMQDAWALAACLHEAPDPPAAFAAYEALRVDRASAVQAAGPAQPRGRA